MFLLSNTKLMLDYQPDLAVDVPSFLKVLATNTDGIYVDVGSTINYQGATLKKMHGKFRSECTYMAESDTHFPELTVREALDFATATRSSQSQYIKNVKTVLVDSFNLAGAVTTQVGNKIIPGISGERRNVSVLQKPW
jgi:ATP-binding cassette subfamily G (WHITE) protein 2 (PDR)